MDIWRKIGQQFSHPSGRFGNFIGIVMGLVNRRPNGLAISALDIHPGDTIVELGFGPGHGLAAMAMRAYAGRIWGIEKSPLMLERARKKNKTLIARGLVELHLADFQQMPFGDGAADKILAVNVVYFWHDPLAVLRECYRVLKTGGRISIYATDAETMKGWKFAGPDTHILYSGNALGKLLEAAGYKDVSISEKYIMPGVRGCIVTAEK